MDNMENSSFDKASWAEQKKAMREDAFARIDTYLEQIPADPGYLQNYLNVQGLFPRCSVSNAVLIADQKPETTEYHTFEGWKKKGVSILKGEQGFSMLVPSGSYTGKDGLTHTRFDVAKVFDITQTNSLIRQKQEDLHAVLRSMMIQPVVPVEMLEKQQRGAEFLPEEGIVTIGQNCPVMQGMQTLSMALAHGELSKMIENYDPVQIQNNLSARCASYMVCRYYGMEPSSYDFKDAQSILGGMGSRALRSQLETIRTATRTMIDRIEKARALLERAAENQAPEQGRGSR